MITTAKGYPGRGGRASCRKTVRVADFESVWADQGEEESSCQALRRILAHGVDHCLTFRQRQVLFLYYKEGKTQTQIARQLRLSPSTVCRHLQASRRRILRLARELALLEGR